MSRTFPPERACVRQSWGCRRRNASAETVEGIPIERLQGEQIKEFPMKRAAFALCGVFLSAIQAYGATLLDAAQTEPADRLQARMAGHTHDRAELTRALHLAVRNNPDPAVLGVLIRAGADPKAVLAEHEIVGGEPDEHLPDSQQGGTSPLEAAWGDLPKMRVLLEHGADPNERDFEGGTRFAQEAARGSVETVALLLQYGADPDIPVDGPNCPRGPDLDFAPAVEGAPCTALEFALHDPRKVKLLLDAGAHTNRLIYSRALEAGLPADLLQRLDPSRFPDGTPKTADGLFASAAASARRKDFAACLETLDDLHRSFALDNAALASLYYLKSLCGNNNLDDAKKARDLDASRSRNHRQYVSALLHRHEYAEALEALKPALRLAPDDVRLYLYRATCLMHLGKLKQAERDIRKALELEEHPQAHHLRGELHLLARRADRAEQDFVKALALGQKINADRNLLYQAALKEHAGDLDAAARLAQEADARPSGTVPAGAEQQLNGIGSPVLMPAGLIDPVRRTFVVERSALLREMQNSWITLFDGREVDTRRMTIDRLQRAAGRKREQPAEAAPFRYLLTFCVAEPEQALKNIDAAIGLRPDEYVYHFRQGELLYLQGRHEAALKALKKALELGQANRVHRNWLYQAHIAAGKGDMQTALRLADKARASAPARDRQHVEQALSDLLESSTSSNRPKGEQP